MVLLAKILALFEKNVVAPFLALFDQIQVLPDSKHLDTLVFCDKNLIG